MNKRNKKLHRISLQICIDWMNSDDFQLKGNIRKLVKASSFYQQIQESIKTSGYNYHRTEQLFTEALGYAEENGWIKRTCAVLGRPRTNSYSSWERSRAEYVYGHPKTSESTRKKLRSVADSVQTHGSQVVTIREGIWKAIYESAPVSLFEGRSREELQQMLNLNPKATNAFWRWLQENGWKVRRIKSIRVICRDSK